MIQIAPLRNSLIRSIGLKCGRVWLTLMPRTESSAGSNFGSYGGLVAAYVCIVKTARAPLRCRSWHSAPLPCDRTARRTGAGLAWIWGRAVREGGRT